MEGFEVILKPNCLVILIVLCLHAMPSAGNFTSFVFGDSLVDAGNNDYIFTLSKADSPPYGIDFTPSGGRPTGRFTNGRTIADIVGNINNATFSIFNKLYEISPIQVCFSLCLIAYSIPIF